MDFFERAIELCEDRKPLKSLEFFQGKRANVRPDTERRNLLRK
jgi:hypothetical protein